MKNRFTTAPSKAVLASAVLTAVLLGTSACSGGSADTATGASDSTLHYGIIGNQNDKLFPYGSASSSSQTMLRYELYDKLTDFSPDGKLKMALAKEIEPNKDFTTWDITLRDDVKFSNGKPLTAEDVVYSFKQMFDKDNNSTVPHLLSMVDPDKVTAVDKHHVRLELTRPFAPLPQNLAYGDIVIISKDSTREKPIGSGPFTVQTYQANREAVLKRNDDYWGEKPDFETLDITYFKDHDAKLNALLSGQVDLVAKISGSDLPQLKSAGKSTISTDSGSYSMIEMRTDVAPFNDHRVVRAFQLMIDRQKVVENAYAGAARVGNDYMAGGDTCPAPDIPQRKQDIPRAKKLLKEAGQENLVVTLTTDGASPGMMESAQVLAQGAKQAGVTVHINKLSTAAFLDKWGDWPMYINITDPPYLVGAYDHFSATGVNNTTKFKSKKFDALLDRMDRTQDEDKLCDIITQSHKVINEDGAEIVAAIPKYMTAFDPSVKGLKKDKEGRASYMFGGVSVGE